MKKQFLHEAHRRQDKVFKPDYQREMLTSDPARVSRSQLELDRLHLRSALRKQELRRASTLYLVYGRWLYQHTSKLSHFAFLNAKHALPDAPETAAAFADCQQKWQLDYPRILEAIKRAPLVKLRGLMWVRGLARPDWRLPDDLVADSVTRSVPADFLHAGKPTEHTATESGLASTTTEGKRCAGS